MSDTVKHFTFSYVSVTICGADTVITPLDTEMEVPRTSGKHN